MNKTIIIFFLSTFLLFSQNNQSNNQSAFHAASFSIKFENSLAYAFDENGKNVFQGKFYHPSGMISDLDADGVDEFIIIDSNSVNRKTVFTVSIFNTVDSFYLVDSINSGGTSPYFQVNEETNKVTLITGNPDFDNYNANPEFFFSPLDCWKYESSELSLNNEEMYELLLTENENIIEFLENYRWNSDSCSTSKEILGAIASAFANYINAGETAIAYQFLRKYYMCCNLDLIKKEFLELLGISD